jgi:hypothetical protein
MEKILLFFFQKLLFLIENGGKIISFYSKQSCEMAKQNLI